MPKKTIEEQIVACFVEMDSQKFCDMLRDMVPLIELYDIQEGHDWVKIAFGPDDGNNIRIVRTVYLLSKFAERYAGALVLVKMRHKDLWRKLEKIADETAKTG